MEQQGFLRSLRLVGGAQILFSSVGIPEEAEPYFPPPVRDLLAGIFPGFRLVFDGPLDAVGESRNRPLRQFAGQRRACGQAVAQTHILIEELPQHEARSGDQLTGDALPILGVRLVIGAQRQGFRGEAVIFAIRVDPAGLGLGRQQLHPFEAFRIVNFYVTLGVVAADVEGDEVRVGAHQQTRQLQRMLQARIILFGFVCCLVLRISPAARELAEAGRHGQILVLIRQTRIRLTVGDEDEVLVSVRGRSPLLLLIIDLPQDLGPELQSGLPVG